MTLPEYFAALDFFNEFQGGPNQGLEFTTKAADEMVTTLTAAVAREDSNKRKKFFADRLGKKKTPTKGKGKAPRGR